MDKLRKLELVKRSLGLRHKIRVHESMKAPDNHEDLAVILLSRWELEDELKAIEEVLAEMRGGSVAVKKAHIDKNSNLNHLSPAKITPGLKSEALRVGAGTFELDHLRQVNE